MAPKPKYHSRKDLHLNVESGIKDIGDFFGLSAADVLRSGYINLINHYIEKYGAPAEIKAQWADITTRDAEEFKQKVETEKALKEKFAHTQEPTTPKPGILKQMLSYLSPDELAWVFLHAKSDQMHVTRMITTQLKTRYSQCTGTPAPFWSEDDEISILNELIDLAGV